MANSMILDVSDAAHFLRRVGYGGTEAEVAHFTGRTVDDVVDEVVDTAVAPLQQPAFMSSDLEGWEKRQVAVDWWIQRMADSRWVDRTPSTASPLVEKMSFFWHGHFATSDEKVNDFPKLYEQVELFHDFGLGDFEYLVQEIAVGGAMLVYLDNATNDKDEPQENFARELMELFTMGVGNYGETDVIEMARAWTGHNTVGWDNVNQVTVNDYIFRSDRHDDGIKTIFGIARNWDGPEAITEIVRGTKQMTTARFIARKVFSHLAHVNPPGDVVDALAAGFVASDMSVRELVRSVLVHPRFWDQNSRYQLVKPPIDFLAELVKRTGMPTEDQGLIWIMGSMGQVPFNPPNVSGWGENGYWLSTATAWGRQRFAERAFWQSESLDLPVLNELGDDGMTADDAADAIFEAFGIVDQSADSRAGIGLWFEEMLAQNPWGLDHEGVIMGATLPEFHVA